MKRTWGVILVVIGGIAVVLCLFLGVFILSFIAGGILGVGIVLMRAPDIGVLKSEIKAAEGGGFRFCVSVKNNQSRPVSVWFVANVYYAGASIGVVNSNTVVLSEQGLGELSAILPLPTPDAKLESYGATVIQWNIK